MKALVAVALLLPAAVAMAADTTHFVFQVPPGWTDLSPGAPEENLNELPPEMRARLHGSGAVFLAGDVAHRGDGFLSNVNATVAADAATVTLSDLDAAKDQIDREVARTARGGQFVIKDKQLVDWDGVTVGRLAGELTIGGQTLAEVIFLIPGDNEHAVLSYTTTPDRLASLEPVFDAAARATKGAKQPKLIWQRILENGGRGAILGFIGAVIALVVIRRLRARRASA